MGNKNPKNQFKKGNTASVGKGRPKVTDEERNIRALLKSEIEKVGSALLSPKYALDQIDLNKDVSIMMKMVIEHAKKGNTKILEMFLDRIVGKPKEQVEHSSSDNGIEIKLNYGPNDKPK